MSIDTAERRSTIHGSPEVSASKHLARAYGFSMRRRRRIGPVVFDLGTAATRSAYGELRFTDEGRLEDANLFGLHQGPLPLIDLASLLEYGTLPEQAHHAEEASALVLNALDEAVTTGPIVLPALEPTLELEPVESLAAFSPLTEPVSLFTGPVALPGGPQTQSIPIPMVLTRKARPPRKTAAEEWQEAVATISPALVVWARFILGVFLATQVTFPMFAAASGADVPGWLVAMSVVGAMIGLVITRYALRDNDQRTVRLQELDERRELREFGVLA